MKITLDGNQFGEPKENASVAEKRTEVVASWLKEIDEYYVDMTQFGYEQSDEIFRKLAAWTARASHIRSQINRNESKVLQNFRIKQIDPFIEECQFQFKVWSRTFSVMQAEHETTFGNKYT